MPTLRKRIEEKHHPRQTGYYIRANPPEVDFVTYQIDPRAVEFLTADCGYADGDSLPWSIVHPLRQIRDLYTLDEGRPRNADPDEATGEDVRTPSLDSDQKAALVEYLADHPDVAGDVGAFETRLKRGDGSYTAVLKREGYTPTDTPGFDSSGDETLDRIAKRYFGDETEGYITWDGERVYDYISVTDREGNVHEFPKIESRLPEGERLRLSRDIYHRWGPEIGESEVNSRRYEPGEDGFPNRWIGQRVGSPEPNLEQAESPRAFYYRTIAGRSHYAPGKEAEEEFEAACEYSLEVYRANFPVAVDPGDLQTEYVPVETATEPWNDFQVPPAWEERYADNGGLPPLKRDPGDELSVEARAVLERHSPGGEGHEWFDSESAGRDLMEARPYRNVLLAADSTEYDVVDFSVNGGGEPVFELTFSSTSTTVSLGSGDCEIYVDGPSDSVWYAVYDGTGITEFHCGDGVDVSDAAETLVDFGAVLSSAADFADAVMSAV